MKKNKKGFTLVELLAVIVILGIILTIAGTNVVKSIKTANQQEVYSLGKSLEDLGPGIYSSEKLKDSSNFIDKYKTGDCFYIEASELKNAGLLKSSIKSPAKKNVDCTAKLFVNPSADVDSGAKIYTSYVSCEGVEQPYGNDLSTEAGGSLCTTKFLMN